MESKALQLLRRGTRGLQNLRFQAAYITNHHVPTLSSPRCFHRIRQVNTPSATTTIKTQYQSLTSSSGTGLVTFSDGGSHRNYSSLSPQNVQSLHYAMRNKDCLSIIASRGIRQHARFLSGAISRQQQKDVGQENANKTLPSTKESTPSMLKKLNPLATKERKENIYNIPNFLTFSRLIAAPAIGYAILTSHPHLALGLFAYAGITDLVDGYLARRFNSQTVVGTVIDPMADKTLMTIVVVCLTIQGVLPTWLAVIVLGRDVALAISAIYFRWISLPPPKTFSRYWDFSLPSAEVHPTEISKINTFLQLLLVGNAMVLPTLPTAIVDAWNLYGVFEGWQFLVAGTTIWSGLSYVFSKDAVKILSEQEAKEKQRENIEKQGSQ